MLATHPGAELGSQHLQADKVGKYKAHDPGGSSKTRSRSPESSVDRHGHLRENAQLSAPMFPPNMGRSAYSKEQQLRKEASAHDDVSRPIARQAVLSHPLSTPQSPDHSGALNSSSNLLFSRYSSGQAK